LVERKRVGVKKGGKNSGGPCELRLKGDGPLAKVKKGGKTIFYNEKMSKEGGKQVAEFV